MTDVKNHDRSEPSTNVWLAERGTLNQMSESDAENQDKHALCENARYSVVAFDPHCHLPDGKYLPEAMLNAAMMEQSFHIGL